MNSIALTSAIFLIIISSGIGQLFDSTQKIVGSVASNAVVLSWEAVDGATQYLVTFENLIRTKTVTETSVAFGELEPNTKYTVLVAAVDRDGSVILIFNDFTFRTLLPKARNLQVKSFTETSIEVMWDMRNDTMSYRIMVKNDLDEVIEPTVAVTRNTAYISGLSRMSFYKIYVTPISAGGIGDTSVIRGRTDGSGVKITNVWQADNGVIGGELKIYRPLNIPKGTFRMMVHLPCLATEIKVWNAIINNKLSKPSDGVYLIVQSEMWQRQRPVIGMNFNLRGKDSSVRCELSENSVFVEFGVSEEDARAELSSASTAIPVQTYEWMKSSADIIPAAGMISVLLSNIYDDVNKHLNSHGKNTYNMKPYYRDFIIAVHTGPQCPGGITVTSVWGMTQKSSDDMPGALPSTLYFVQTETQWPSNDLGLIYGYNPAVCSNRAGITAEVLQGGDFVDIIFAAPYA